jgi:hypothetical protein
VSSHFEVRRKSNVTLSFIHARTRAFIWTRSRTDRALESNELNGRNISSWIKAKYDRERASREITRLDVVTRREREENNCVSSPPRNWEKKTRSYKFARNLNARAVYFTRESERKEAIFFRRSKKAQFSPRDSSVRSHFSTRRVLRLRATTIQI